MLGRAENYLEWLVVSVVSVVSVVVVVVIIIVADIELAAASQIYMNTSICRPNCLTY